MIFLASIILASAFLPQETFAAEPAKKTSTKQERKVSSEIPLTANAFFQPLEKNKKRPSEWPDHVTLQDELFSTEKFHQRINGSWQTVYHCGGVPLPIEFLQRYKLKIGRGKLPLEILHLDPVRAVGAYTQLFPIDEQGKEKKTSVEVRLNLLEAPNGQFIVDMNPVDLKVKDYKPFIIAPKRILETGEVVFNIEKGSDFACPGIKDVLSVILVPIPMS